MKRWWIWVLAAALLLSSLLSCGEDLTPSPYGEDDFAQEGAVLRVEHERYDKSVESFNYSVENIGEETLFFGAEFAIEVERKGEWYALPLSEDAMWNSIGYEVAPGEVFSNSFSFWPFQYTLSDGNYRLIKEINGKRYCAAFAIGSGEDGYAYRDWGDLEDRPLSLEAGEIECDVRIGADGAIEPEGEERVIEFLRHAAEGTGDTLRMVTTDADGQPVVYDVIYDGSHFLFRRDNRRSGGEIQDRRYSFLVTDGEAVCLSDWATLDEEVLGARQIQAERTVLLHRDWFSDWEAITAEVEAMTAQRLSGGVTLARFWSEDGVYWVDLSREKLDYTVSTKGYGMSRTVTGCGEDAEIIAVRWESPTQVRLFCTSGDAETDERIGWYAVFDVEQEKVVVQGRTLLPEA